MWDLLVAPEPQHEGTGEDFRSSYLNELSDSAKEIFVVLFVSKYTKTSNSRYLYMVKCLKGI
jgi:hypothetical protein